MRFSPLFHHVVLKDGLACRKVNMRGICPLRMLISTDPEVQNVFWFIGIFSRNCLSSFGGYSDVIAIYAGLKLKIITMNVLLVDEFSLYSCSPQMLQRHHTTVRPSERRVYALNTDSRTGTICGQQEADSNKKAEFCTEHWRTGMVDTTSSLTPYCIDPLRPHYPALLTILFHSLLRRMCVRGTYVRARGFAAAETRGTICAPPRNPPCHRLHEHDRQSTDPRRYD